MKNHLCFLMCFLLLCPALAYAGKKKKKEEESKTPTTYLVYDIALKTVERPADAKDKYGETTVTPTEQEGVKKYFLKMAWSPP